MATHPPVGPGAVTAGTPAPEAVASACRGFRIEGVLERAVPFHRGHIHDTWVSTWRYGTGRLRFLHQRLNDAVFPDIPGLMHNIGVVTAHVERRLAAEAASGFHTLCLVPALDGTTYLRDASGAYWRTYRFIEGTTSFDVCVSEEQAFEAARVFGRFQHLLDGIEVGALYETIPRFFSASHRMQQLEQAIERDVAGRRASAAAEIAFALDRRDLVSVIDDAVAGGRMPCRVVHGDTKLNNVLFRTETDRAVAVVDLDTCMPAWSLYDFGDLVRFTAARHAEDERDPSRVGIDLDLFRALVGGYLEFASGFLTKAERELMGQAARIVTFTIGLRFLADDLAGDVYFKTDRFRQNLDRCRAQFGMVADMERQAGRMDRILRAS